MSAATCTSAACQAGLSSQISWERPECTPLLRPD
jgi:hypothetical protein